METVATKGLLCLGLAHNGKKRELDQRNTEGPISLASAQRGRDLSKCSDGVRTNTFDQDTEAQAFRAPAEALIEGAPPKP